MPPTDINDSDVLSQILQEIKFQNKKLDEVRSELSNQKENLASLKSEIKSEVKSQNKILTTKLGKAHSDLSGEISKVRSDLSDQKENLTSLTTAVSFLKMTNRSINIPEGGQNRFGPRGEAAGESRRDWVRERFYRR